MSKIHILIEEHRFCTKRHLTDIKGMELNAAKIVGQGIKACEEILEAEDKMQEEDLKR